MWKLLIPTTQFKRDLMIQCSPRDKILTNSGLIKSGNEINRNLNHSINSHKAVYNLFSPNV